MVVTLSPAPEYFGATTVTYYGPVNTYVRVCNDSPEGIKDCIDTMIYFASQDAPWTDGYKTCRSEHSYFGVVVTPLAWHALMGDKHCPR